MSEVAYPRFALVAQPRSGTHFFRSLLNQNVKIHCFGEVLFPWNHHWGFFSWLKARLPERPELLYPHNWRPEFRDCLNALYLDMVEEHGKTHVGFDLQIPHLLALPDSCGALRECGYGIIHLKRINTAAAVISSERASIVQSMNCSVHSNKKNAVPNIKLNTEVFKEQIWEYQMGDHIIEHRLGKHGYVQIFYEDLLTEKGRKLTEVKLSRLFGTSINLLGGSRYAKQSPLTITEKLQYDDEALDVMQRLEKRVEARAFEIAALP